MNPLDDPKFKTVVHHYAMACCCSREHSALAATACEKYGDHGPLISGCVREHFPEDVKNLLRDLAFAVTKHSDLAWKARPKHVREDTIRKIGRLVAQRDGSGFYGPQAQPTAGLVLPFYLLEAIA